MATGSVFGGLPLSRGFELSAPRLQSPLKSYIFFAMIHGDLIS